jgi:tRNA A-37 threonylcarbamoyl transferase component Bud32
MRNQSARVEQRTDGAQSDRQLLEQLLVEVRELRAQLVPRPSVDADVAVARAIATLGLTQSRSGSARELFAAASADITLRQALENALIDDASQLGACLGRLHRRGLVHRDMRRGRWGWQWRV